MMSDGLLVTPSRDCAICLQKCHHPTQLPCGHIFCFLCVKGVAIQNRKCAMCRAEIPPDYLDHPILLEKLSPLQNADEFQVEYQWYYEGRNGWWKYDERSNVDLENSFNNGDADCKLLLAGALYSIDFQSMTQVKCNDPTRRRRVKRDTPLLPAKGVAGIKTESTNTITNKDNNDLNTNTVDANNSRVVDIDDDDDDIEIIEVEPIVIEIDAEVLEGNADVAAIDEVSDSIQRLSVRSSSNGEQT